MTKKVESGTNQTRYIACCSDVGGKLLKGVEVIRELLYSRSVIMFGWEIGMTKNKCIRKESGKSSIVRTVQVNGVVAGRSVGVTGLEERVVRDVDRIMMG